MILFPSYSIGRRICFGWWECFAGSGTKHFKRIKGYLEGRKTGSLSLESNLVWTRETFPFMKNMEDGGHLLLCTLLFPACLTKKLIQMSAVLDFWEYKGCEDADELPCLCTINSSLTCWTWGWDNRSVSCGMPLAPREIRKAGDRAWHLLPRAFFTSEGARWCL